MTTLYHHCSKVDPNCHFISVCNVIPCNRSDVGVGQSGMKTHGRFSGDKHVKLAQIQTHCRRAVQSCCLMLLKSQLLPRTTHLNEMLIKLLNNIIGSSGITFDYNSTRKRFLFYFIAH